MSDRMVKVTNSTGFGVYTKVVDAISDEEIHGIKSVEIPRFEHNERVVVSLEMRCRQIDIKGTAEFTVVDPGTGKLRAVKQITFVDGDKLDF